MTHTMKKILILIIAGLCVAIAGYLIYNTIVFHVSGANPPNGGSATNGTQTITVSFSRPIKEVNLERNIITNEDIIFGLSTLGNKLVLQTKNLEVNKIYKINLMNIESTDGKIIKQYSYSFTNRYADYNELSKAQQKKAMENQGKGNIEDPALTVLPVSTDRYYIESSILDQPQEGKQIQITIALLVTRSQEDNTALIKQYKQEALEFLRQRNIDISRYVVVYSPRSATGL